MSARPPARVTVPELLAAAVASDPGRPRLTWYGADGERVELSARVLLNWVAKTANLLVEELLDPPAPGRSPVVVLDLPVHWRSAVWGLAAWAVGAHPVDGGGDATDATGDPDVVVTSAPAAAPAVRRGGAPLVVVELAALAFSATDVPAGALDHNAVVAGYGDHLPTGVDPVVLDVGGPDVGALDVEALATADAGGLDVGPEGPGALDVEVLGSGPAAPTGPPAPRVLLDAGRLDHGAALAAVVAALAADGSVVLHGPGAPEPEHLAAVERTTAREP